MCWIQLESDGLRLCVLDHIGKIWMFEVENLAIEFLASVSHLKFETVPDWVVSEYQQCSVGLNSRSLTVTAIMKRLNSVSCSVLFAGIGSGICSVLFFR